MIARLGKIAGMVLAGVLFWGVMIVLCLFQVLPWWPHSRAEWGLFVVLGPPVYLLLLGVGEWIGNGMPFDWLSGWRPRLGLRVVLWTIALLAFTGIGIGMAIFATTARSLPMLLVFGPIWVVFGWLPMHYWLAALREWQGRKI